MFCTPLRNLLRRKSFPISGDISNERADLAVFRVPNDAPLPNCSVRKSMIMAIELLKTS